MNTTYHTADDILTLRLCDKPIAREISQDWNVHFALAADGTVVELVVLDARKSGLLPVDGEPRVA